MCPHVHILATADIHSPKYLHKFCDILQKHASTLESVDLVIIAGDLMHKGSISGLQELDSVLDKFLHNNVKVLACPGNEDFEEVLAKVKNLKRIKILEDSLEEALINNVRVGAYFTRGVLDKPTIWQKRHIKNIDEIYRQRLEKMKNAIVLMSQKYDVPILVSHYAVTYQLLEGEDPKIWPHLGTCRLDDVLQKYKVLVIHGHAHNSTRRFAVFGSSYLVNVSLPGRDSAYLIEVDDGLHSVRVFELRSSGEKVMLEPCMVAESKQQARTRRSIIDFLQ